MGADPGTPFPAAGEFRRLSVRGRDGVSISAQSWGRQGAPAIVFVHGFAQSHLCWKRQLRGPLGDAFHLVTYDLRGHGGSGKPMRAEAYSDPSLWADDLQAV